MMMDADEQQATRPNKPALSKRQRRAAGSNPSTTWQQQPRIKSAGARARAYVSYAGLADDNNGADADADGKNKTKKKKKSNGAGGTKVSSKDLLDPHLDLHSPEVKFGRLLGGTDQRSRHAAVKMLREYLRARSDFTNGGSGLSELDLMKLWKGLWYTLYMADKAPVQDKLSKILAELMWCLSGTEQEDEYAGQVYLQMENGGLNEGDGVFEDDEGDTMEIVEMAENSDEEEREDDEDKEEDDEEAEEETRIREINETHCRGAHLVSLYISTFLQTVRREWGNVDKHRVDKFYTAVRFMVSEAYKYMSKRHWNLGIIRLFNDVLFTEGLSAETPGLTNGLRYHLIDICVDELAKVNKDAGRPLTEATFLDCLEPFFALAQKAEDKNVQKRVMNNVLLKFLNEYSFVCATAIGDEVEDEEKELIFNQVHVGTVSKFIFEIASDNDTDERFRKSLYEMHKTYVRQVRAAGKDVDLDHYSGDGEGLEAENVDEVEARFFGEEEAVEENCESAESQENDSAKATGEEAPATTPTASEKKKKRKKKKNKGDKESVKEEAEAPKMPNANDDEENTTPKTKSSSKKKRKKQEKENEAAAEANAQETPKAAEEGNAATSTPKSKSSKKKRKKQDKDSAKKEADDTITSHVETPSPKSRKKQKSPPSVDPRSMHSPDQVISPSNTDDEAAALLAESAAKRVKFGAMNHCKSWKASMKALNTLDQERWDTANRTPDKGILRPKFGGEAESSEKKSKKKKKAKKKGNDKPPLGPSSTRSKSKGKGKKQG